MVAVAETVTMGVVTVLVGVVPAVGVLLMNERRSTVTELVVGVSEVRMYPDILGCTREKKRERERGGGGKDQSKY